MICAKMLVTVAAADLASHPVNAFYGAVNRWQNDETARGFPRAEPYEVGSLMG